MGPFIIIIFYYINPNKIHMSQSLFYLTTALHVSGITITHLQEHKTTVTTASGNRYIVLLSGNRYTVLLSGNRYTVLLSGNRYTVLLSAAIVEELELI